MEKKQNAAENKWLKRILRISYIEHITNEEIRKRTQQQLVSEVIKKRRMKWAGYVLRMDENRNPKKIFNYKPEGKRTVGRPKRRQKDCFEEDLKAAGITIHGKTEGRQRMTIKEMAMNREMWRDIIEESLAGGSLRMFT